MHKIVCAGDIRQRIVLQDLQTDRVEAARWNRVVWELRPRRRGGIEDRLGKDALPLRQCGNHAEPRDAGAQPRALPIGEEKCLVRLDRTAGCSAVLVAPEYRLRTGLREQVARIQGFIPEEFKKAAVELVA